MTRLLLDHPWPLDEALSAGSDAYQVLLEFRDLVRKTGLAPVRFVQQTDYDNAVVKLGKTTAAANIRRFSYNLVRHINSVICATPQPTPPLSDFWKSALNDELDVPENWRNPQIIFPEKRRAVWPNAREVAIACPSSTSEVLRVLASLNNYDAHPLANGDTDPWHHFEHLWPPAHGVNGDKPCWLPRPPTLEKVPIEQLSERLVEARKSGWYVDGKYFYIPSDDHKLEEVSQKDWRSGYAFPRKKPKGWKGPCPIDYKGQVWCWDKNERHWDVQLNPHISINHLGYKL